jgi:hypothetical protein
MAKFRRVFNWIFWNTLQLGAAYLWLFQGIQWAENLTRFWIVFGFVYCLLIAFNSPARLEIGKKGRSVPALLSKITCLALVTALAAHGNFFMASLVFLNACLEAYTFEPSAKELEA